jgi:hypothetical protein
MSVLDVNSIASLEALNSALSQYRTASDGPFRRFAPIFAEKLELLATLEAHFIKKVEQAETQLEYAQRAYFACMNNPDRISCSSEASMVRQAQAMLERAIENLETYRSLMSRMQGVSDSYHSAANRYAGNLQNISSSIVPNFSSLIGKMKAYASDGSDVLGGGVGNTVESSYSLSALRAAAINAGVVDIAHDGISGGIAVGDSGKNSGDKKGADTRSGSDAAANSKSSTGSSAPATGVYVVAGVGVAALSAGILAYFKNNGFDNDTASREIHRVLTAKYGAPMGGVQQAEYIKDYNALSKAVEEDMKKQAAKEIKKKERKLKAEKEKLEKYSVPWNGLFQNMSKQQMATVLNQLITINGGEMPEFVLEGPNDYRFQDKKTGDLFFVEKDGSKIETAQRLIKDPKLKVSVFESNNNKSIDYDVTKREISAKTDLSEQKEDGMNIGAKAGVIATGDGVRYSQIYVNENGSAHKLVAEVKVLDFDAYAKTSLKGTGLKAKLDLVNGEGQYAYIQSPALENNNGVYHIHQKEYTGKLGAGLGVSAKAEILKDELDVQGKLLVKLGVAYKNHDLVKNFKQLPTAVTNKFIFNSNNTPDYLNNMRDFHISTIPEVPLN